MQGPLLVSMKKGRLSSSGRWVGGRDQGPLVVWGLGAVLMSLWPPRREDQAKSDASLSGASQKGGQAARREAAPLGAKDWCFKACMVASISARRR